MAGTALARALGVAVGASVGITMTSRTVGDGGRVLVGVTEGMRVIVGTAVTDTGSWADENWVFIRSNRVTNNPTPIGIMKLSGRPALASIGRLGKALRAPGTLRRR